MIKLSSNQVAFLESLVASYNSYFNDDNAISIDLLVNKTNIGQKIIRNNYVWLSQSSEARVKKLRSILEKDAIGLA